MLKTKTNSLRQYSVLVVPLSVASLALVIVSIYELSAKGIGMSNKQENPDSSSAQVDTTPRVTGIGGIFF